MKYVCLFFNLTNFLRFLTAAEESGKGLCRTKKDDKLKKENQGKEQSL